MISSKKSYALRVDEVQFEKLKVIASDNHRSVNSQIEALIAECVKKYEAENGTISVEFQE